MQDGRVLFLVSFTAQAVSAVVAHMAFIQTSPAKPVFSNVLLLFLAIQLSISPACVNVVRPIRTVLAVDNFCFGRTNSGIALLRRVVLFARAFVAQSHNRFACSCL